MLYGYRPSLSWLQLGYYIGAALPLVLGITWITGSVVVFFRDMGQIVAMAIQFGFWLTPIFWSLDAVPEEYRSILELNPAHYIVQGYRESLTNGGWFWEKPIESVVYWGIALGLFWGGRMVFKALRPHFADVL
jgi:lipopolysaccharide transport system permease protein/teichoic acid transport system permease protein